MNLGEQCGCQVSVPWAVKTSNQSVSEVKADSCTAKYLLLLSFITANVQVMDDFLSFEVKHQHLSGDKHSPPWNGHTNTHRHTYMYAHTLTHIMLLESSKTDDSNGFKKKEIKSEKRKRLLVLICHPMWDILLSKMHSFWGPLVLISGFVRKSR